MLQKLGILSGIDIDLYTTAVYEGGGGREIDSKAFSAKHIVTH